MKVIRFAKRIFALKNGLGISKIKIDQFLKAFGIED